MKVFEIVVTFLDPARGVVQIMADSAESAINELKARIGDQVQDLNIESVNELASAPELDTGDLAADRTVN